MKEKMKKQRKQVKKTILMKEKTGNERPLKMTKPFDHIDSSVALETRNRDSQKSFLMKVESPATGGGEVMLETESWQ